ncbi:PPOX class F420-dependent oxidoreductase [Segeticoccus rhizosphaerae]|uniref:PPOX class F420-dependent oxidoreductase n=1 Tax=Segeticoccus rhizosphaerae TaxID=1104777 RepID=UPI0010C103A5|nr:PPOX class F420-dependent oxidoreductase [Ornithinicoccus soli]
MNAGRQGRGRATGGYFGALSRRTYIQLVTFRRNGTPVGTPVHLAAPPDGERGYFRTWHTTGKAKRVRHTKRVELAPSTFRGRPVGEPIPATVRLLKGVEAKVAADLLAARHPVLHGILIPRYHRMRGWRTLHYELTRPSASEAVNESRKSSRPNVPSETPDE